MLVMVLSQPLLRSCETGLSPVTLRRVLVPMGTLVEVAMLKCCFGGGAIPVCNIAELESLCPLPGILAGLVVEPVEVIGRRAFGAWR